MSSLTDRILAILAKATPQQPMRGDDLLAHLGLGIDPDTVNDALDALFNRAAINRAEITKAGHTHTALWPTGIPPKAVSWRCLVIDKHTQDDARAKHQATRIVPSPQPSPSGGGSKPMESNMPRKPYPSTRLTSQDVEDRVRAALAGSGPANGIRLGALRTATGIQSASTICRALDKLAEAGLISHAESKGGRRYYRAGWYEEVEVQPPHDEAVMPPPSIEAVEIAAVTPPEPAPRRRAIDRIVEDMLQTPPQPTQRPCYLLDDDGHLSISVGDEMIHLVPGDVRRLSDFLRSTVEVYE